MIGLNKLKVYKSFVRMEFRALLREPITVFFMIFLPIIFTVVFGGAFGAEDTVFGESIKGIDTVVPINLVFLIANVGLMGIPITVIELKEQGVLKRYDSYPITFASYFLSIITAFAILSIISVIIFGTLSFVIYDAKFHMDLVSSCILLLLFISSTIVFDSIGFIVALLIPNARVANIFCSGIFLAMIFTSGVVMPVEAMPLLVQKIALLSPMYHFTELVTYAWVDHFVFSDLIDHIIFVVASTTIFVVFLSKVKLKWD